MTATTRLFPNARLIAICVALLSLRLSAPAGEIALEDDALRVAFDSDSGALARMESKPKHWVIERRPELGVSFRLFAPSPHRRYNPVLGQKQHAVEARKTSDNEVNLLWKKPVGIPTNYTNTSAPIRRERGMSRAATPT